MRLALTWMSVWTTAVLCGCASRGNVEMLEGRLRVQEDQIYALQRQLKTAGSELVAARRETEALRAEMTQYASAMPAPEESRAFHRVEGIRINKLLTGGLNRDGQPGHDHLSTVIVPVDAQGELVKVPGALRIELIDLTGDGAERQVGVWEFSAEEAEQFWKKGFVGSGYSLTLPWQQTPQSEKLTLHARLTTTDGRQFDTSHEVAISLAGEATFARKDRRRPARMASKPSGKATLKDTSAPALERPGFATPGPADEEIEMPPRVPANKPAPALEGPQSRRTLPRSAAPLRRAGAITTPRGRARLPDVEPEEWETDPQPVVPDEASPDEEWNDFPEDRSPVVPPPRDLDDDPWESLPAPSAKNPPKLMTPAPGKAAREEPAEDEEASDSPPFETETRRPIRTSDRWTNFDAPVIR
ncbi:MAG: hypothetical protein IT428_22125 [Planctomycetaceae bacterium]|nr:hypothetical protein [Planctomycetaceae bacterium]